MTRSTRRSRVSAADIVAGAIAGTTATVAMTLAADALFRRLPPHERYPLPPREITEGALESVGGTRQTGEEGMVAASLLAHFAFGAATGALFPLLRCRSVAGGAGYGLLVWTFSYFGWVPALGLLRNAASHPIRRSALMIFAHLVWGATLGTVYRRLSRSLAPLRAGRIGDR